MKKIDLLLEKLQEDLEKNNVKKSVESIKDNLILVLGDTNELFLIQNNNINFYSKCTTWKNWFWNESWSNKTPLWLHKVIWYYGDGLSEKAILKWRKYTGEDLKNYPSYPDIYPLVLTRILQLEWLEDRNSNTKQRYIYVHWVANIWYWETKNLKRSFWCIGLKPKDMIELFDKVKWKETFVYILKSVDE